jgi:hypothetical protein
MNYGMKYSLDAPDHQIQDANDAKAGDYVTMKGCPNGSQDIYIHYFRIISRTNKFITITDEDKFVKLSWNEQGKYWGKNQGYCCDGFINEYELPNIQL